MCCCAFGVKFQTAMKSSRESGRKFLIAPSESAERADFALFFIIFFFDMGNSIKIDLNSQLQLAFS